MGLTPPVGYGTVEVKMSWGFRALSRYLGFRSTCRRIWISRGFPVGDWRARYRGVKYVEQKHQRDIERRVMFGK
jgi:hypothetical protein